MGWTLLSRRAPRMNIRGYSPSAPSRTKRKAVPRPITRSAGRPRPSQTCGCDSSCATARAREARRYRDPTVGRATRQRRSVEERGTAYRRVAHAAGLRGATAWAKLRSSVQTSSSQCQAIFAHPTALRRSHRNMPALRQLKNANALVAMWYALWAGPAAMHARATTTWFSERGGSGAERP
jgi:hypothetical protein